MKKPFFRLLVLPTLLFACDPSAPPPAAPNASSSPPLSPAPSSRTPTPTPPPPLACGAKICAPDEHCLEFPACGGGVPSPVPDPPRASRFECAATVPRDCSGGTETRVTCICPPVPAAAPIGLPPGGR